MAQWDRYEKWKPEYGLCSVVLRPSYDETQSATWLFDATAPEVVFVNAGLVRELHDALPITALGLTGKQRKRLKALYEAAGIIKDGGK